MKGKSARFSGLPSASSHLLYFLKAKADDDMAWKSGEVFKAGLPGPKWSTQNGSWMDEDRVREIHDHDALTVENVALPFRKCKSCHANSELRESNVAQTNAVKDGSRRGAPYRSHT